MNTRGYNAKTGTVEDLMESGVIDPSTVVKTSVRNALSVAATILTTQVIVTLPRQELPKPPEGLNVI